VIQAGNDPERDGIAAHGEDDWDCGRCRFRGAYRRHAPGRGDDRDTLANQISR